MLIMDLLYECGRYQDVVLLMTHADQYMDKKYADLVTITLAALYKMVCTKAGFLYVWEKSEYFLRSGIVRDFCQLWTTKFTNTF